MRIIDGYPARYLGDGVYALYNGHQVELRVDNPTKPTHTVYLEGSVLRNLVEFQQEAKKRLEEANDQEPEL